MIREAKTIHEHFQRQATPDVWAEVDDLRKRVAELEALVVALRAVNAAQGIEAATAAETVELGSVHESPVPQGCAQTVPKGAI